MSAVTGLLVISQLLQAAIAANISILELNNKIKEVDAAGGSPRDVFDWVKNKAHENLNALDAALKEQGF